MISSKLSKLNRLSNLIISQSLKRFSTANQPNRSDYQFQYKSPKVESRFYAKPVPKFSLGEILRIEHIVKNVEQYYDKEGIIAGWARTVR